MIGDVAAQPLRALDELERRGRTVELRPDVNRDGKIRDGGDQRHPARRVGAAPRVATGKQDKQPGDHGQEGDNREDGKMAHSAPPATMNQVISTSAPASIASA